MTVLIVDDEIHIRESLGKYIALEGMKALLAGDCKEAQKILSREPVDALVLDLKMPGMSGHEMLAWMQGKGMRQPVIMISAHGEIADAVSALKNGASDYLVKPFDPDELVHRLRSIVTGRKNEDTLEAARRGVDGDIRLTGKSQAMSAVARIVTCVSPSDSTVLITGESGTGKEVVAREIHASSPRRDEPFVAVNVGAMHGELMESELFGHEKGAFTGADSRKLGLFELAGSGTLFLDEIGEMPLQLQVKLLRVLQERTIRRLGGTANLPVGARILSATNRDIEGMVQRGAFREDLYYRLNVVRIGMPPLRERKEDISPLATDLLRRLCARMNRRPCTLSESALILLRDYDFPGNVRELENILERALIYCSGDIIEGEAMDVRGLSATASAIGPSNQSESGGPSPSTKTAPLSLDETERQAIEAALKRHGGNRTHASAELGISRRTIINKIKLYGLR